MYKIQVYYFRMVALTDWANVLTRDKDLKVEEEKDRNSWWCGVHLGHGTSQVLHTVLEYLMFTFTLT